MPHVIGKSCVNHSSCLFTVPGELYAPCTGRAGLRNHEMLFSDPAACVDCGACVRAYPVDAIAPDTRLEPKQWPFVRKGTR